MKKTKNIIAISGKSGCGNTTVSKIISEKLGYTFINLTFRQIADRHSISFEEMLKLSETDPKYDIELDNENIRLARVGETVLGSRLAIWLLKDEAVTVYINAGLDKRTRNILTRENGTYQEIYDFTKTRDENDHNRFKRLYDIDNNDFSFADIVIEADNMDVDQVVNDIINKLKEIGS